MGEQVVPVEMVQAVAGQVAVIASVVLIQSDGDAANAIARLESQRGQVNVMADNESGFRMDVVQAAQEAIEAAAQINEDEEGVLPENVRALELLPGVAAELERLQAVRENLITEALAEGESERAIGRAAGLSGVAIHNRRRGGIDG